MKFILFYIEKLKNSRSELVRPVVVVAAAAVVVVAVAKVVEIVCSSTTVEKQGEFCFDDELMSCFQQLLEQAIFEVVVTISSVVVTISSVVVTISSVVAKR